MPGLPITNYCDQHKLTLRQRLELFIQVCEGVKHAHQKESSIATEAFEHPCC